MALTTDQLLSHLLRRAGFGPSQSDLTLAYSLGFDGMLDRLVNDGQIVESLDPTGGVPSFDPTKLDHQRLLWLYRMVNSQKQLREKMTFFWHNHFATSNNDVNDVRWMARQNDFFRANALADFRTILQGISKDPAMMINLDTTQNSKNAPNENYAREIMELYALGIGNYTEDDIKNAARCFTGWRFNSTTGDFVLNAGAHDTGIKTIYPGTPVAKSGNLDGDDVVNAIVEHPATGPFLAAKLFTFFVADTPDKPTIDACAALYYSSGFSIKAMVQFLLSSDIFRSETSYRSRVKSPLELLVGLVKHLQLAKVPFEYPTMFREQTLDLFNPPSVKGWPDSLDWIGTTLLQLRANHINKLVSSKGSDGKYYWDPVGYAGGTNKRTADELIAEFLRRWVDSDVTDGVVTKLKAYYAAGPRKASLSRDPYGVPLPETPPDDTAKQLAAAAADLAALPASTYRIFVTGAFDGFSPTGTDVLWTTQKQKIRGLAYLILSSPAYQLN